MLKLLAPLMCLACWFGDAAATGAVGFPPASTITMPPGNNAKLPGASTVRVEAPAAGAITSVVLENLGDRAQAGTPLTFGQVFAPGHVPAGTTLRGTFGGSAVPIQLDIKATHADGSVRHGLVSLIVPSLEAGARRRLDLVKATASAPGAPVRPAALLDKGFSAAVSITLGDRTYSASADALLRTGKFDTWIAGPIASEWLLATPLTDSDGTPHPHLSVRFAIRAAGRGRARVDVTIENSWAFAPAPQNYVYDAQIIVGGKTVDARRALTHYHHARWRKVVWWGAPPQLHVRHDTAYLIASRALPHYDQQVSIGETALAALERAWTGPKTEPMGVGLAHPGMPTTGGRPDIGLLPSWAVTYLLSMDARAAKVTLGTADLAGSWSAHYRDQATGRPVSLKDYPYMTVLGQRTDTVNPATGKQEAFPLCAASQACATPNKHDAAHQPGFAYLPYLLTGDHYYLEELQFWAMWNTFMSNPGYRAAGQGLFKSDQVRAQAWSLRTLGQAAYITPDRDPLKGHFLHFLDANLAWYNANYTSNPAANQLGVIVNGSAIVYEGGTGLAPWMDDFFTAAVGHLAELGFAEAQRLLEWKVKFPIARMQDKGACWVTGSIYALKVRDTATTPLYTSMAEAWRASHTEAIRQLPCGSTDMARALKLRPGEMSGYSSVPTGFPSNLQPALAYAADVGGKQGTAAWKIFFARSVKPDYGNGPQFAIIPRP